MGWWPPSTARPWIRCAAALRDELGGIGVQLRVGLHTGEVELRDGDVGGIAVHIAARVMAAAGPGEILTSRTVRDLIVGSDIVLDDRGTTAVAGRRGYLAAVRGGGPSGASSDR